LRPLLIASLALSIASTGFAQSAAPAGQPQSAPAGNQLQGPAPVALPETPVFRTGAHDVVIDVIVTDDKGNQITGLPQSAFSVLEDKKPQSIDFFEEHATKSLPPGELKPLPAMPPGVFTNVPPAPESDAVNVLLLDTLNTPQQDFTYARNQLIQFLQKVPPGTRMAIVVLSDKLTFVQGFTADASALQAAVQEKKKGANPQSSPALISRSEEAANNGTIAFRAAESAVGGYSNTGATLSVAAIQGAFAAYQDFAHRNATLMTLEALSDLARYLSSVPGRKNLIWFSSSFPVFIYPNLAERGEAQDLIVPLSQVRKTADALTAARVAVYPVNARGMMDETVMSADSLGIANTPSIGAAAGINNMSPFTADASNRANVMYEMNQLAADTGGKALYNTNDLSAATLRAIGDGSHYYTITYSPTNKKLDGSYRSIAVKLANGRYKLDYRRGYNADEPTGIASDKADKRDAVPAPAAPANPLQPLMRLGMPASTEILYGLRVNPAADQPSPGAPRAGKNSKLTGPVTRLSVDFMIRWTDVHFSPVEEGADKGMQSGRIRVELLAYDPSGKVLNWVGGTEEMALNAADYASIQKSGVPAHLEIDVPKGQDIFLSTGIYDWQTGKIGTLQVPIPASAQSSVASAAGSH